jgi:hypothetical protein
MGLLKTLKDSDISLFFFKMLGLALFFFVSLLIAQPLFYYQNFDNNAPKIEFDVTTDRLVYDIGDVVTIDGFLKLDYFYSNVNVQISIFNWGEASTELLVEVNRDFRAIMPVRFSDLNNGRPVQWVCNEPGEYGVNIYMEKEDDPETFSMSFLKEHFLVIENGLFLDVYTDQVEYITPQIMNITCRIFSEAYLNDVNAVLLLTRGSEIIGEISSGVVDVPVEEEVHIKGSYSSTGLEGAYEIRIELKGENTLLNGEGVSKSTKITIEDGTNLKAMKDTLTREHPWLQEDPLFLYTILEISATYTDPSKLDPNLLGDILEGYNSLDRTDKTALFLIPSCGDSYATTGDLILWLYTDFLDATDLEKIDADILFSYAAVYDDYFIREQRNSRYWKIFAWNDETDALMSWIKDYMIEQCTYFGKEMLRTIADEHGVSGLLHVIYPNFDESFGDLRYNFMPLEGYRTMKEYLETEQFEETDLRDILVGESPIEAMDRIQSILWSKTISSETYTSSDPKSNPTTLGFYVHDVTKLNEEGRVLGSCVTVSRLVALMGRTLGLPIGIINPSSETGHWGNYQLFNGIIVPDTQSQEIYETDKEASEESYVIRWPSLFHYRKRGFGLTNEYKEEFGDPLASHSQMEIEEYLDIVSYEMREIIKYKADFYQRLLH